MGIVRAGRPVAFSISLFLYKSSSFLMFYIKKQTTTDFPKSFNIIEKPAFKLGSPFSSKAGTHGGLV